MTTTLLILAAISVLCVSALSFALGVRRGRNLGWLNYHFDLIAKDRARRERDGKFKEVAR